MFRRHRIRKQQLVHLKQKNEMRKVLAEEEEKW